KERDFRPARPTSTSLATARLHEPESQQTLNRRYSAPVGYFQTPWHIVLLLLIALLLFGGKRLPEIGKALGSGMREFKDAVTGNSPAAEDPKPELPPAEPAVTQTTAVTPTMAPPTERDTVQQGHGGAS